MFRLHIYTGVEKMRTLPAICVALAQVIRKLWAGQTAGGITDEDGATVGQYDYALDAEAPDGTLGQNDPTNGAAR